MRSHRRRFLSFLLVAVVGSVILIAATIAVAGQATRHRLNRPAHSGVSRSLVAHFAVFRHSGKFRARVAAASTDPSMNRALSNLAEAPEASQYGLDVSDAETVSVSSAFSVTVVPGSDGVCVLASQPGTVYAAGLHNHHRGAVTTCGTVAHADAVGIQMTLGGAGADFAWGMVPDGNETVGMTTASGSTFHPQVVDNIYAASTPAGQGFASVSFVNASGTATTQELP